MIKIADESVKQIIRAAAHQIAAHHFGETERRLERQLRDDYFATVTAICDGLSEAGLARATALANLPDMVRGFGPVKAAAMAEYALQRAALLDTPVSPVLTKAA